jgi:hypothetical protein
VALIELISKVRSCLSDACLRQVFRRIAEHPINRIEELLPWCMAEDLIDTPLAA